MTRAGGTYIPPAKLRAMQQQISDKSSPAFQRTSSRHHQPQILYLYPIPHPAPLLSLAGMAWDALKKSINGIVNKVNVSNIKNIVPELFQENLVRGRFVLLSLSSPPSSPSRNSIP